MKQALSSTSGVFAPPLETNLCKIHSIPIIVHMGSILWSGETGMHYQGPACIQAPAQSLKLEAFTWALHEVLWDGRMKRGTVEVLS